jgi:hypothetical protein
MASDELINSWNRTEGYLRDARSHLSEIAEVTCADQVRSFESYMEHNELELALDTLEEVFETSGFEDWRVLELMALAAASMRLLERQRRYDGILSRARGWTYETALPE